MDLDLRGRSHLSLCVEGKFTDKPTATCASVNSNLLFLLGIFQPLDTFLYAEPVPQLLRRRAFFNSLALSATVSQGLVEDRGYVLGEALPPRVLPSCGHSPRTFGRGAVKTKLLGKKALGPANACLPSRGGKGHDVHTKSCWNGQHRGCAPHLAGDLPGLS